MPYTDFTLDTIEAKIGLTTQPGNLFPGLAPVAVPSWLTDSLRRGKEVAALVSEKARSEFLVAPILIAARELVTWPVAVFSGQRLDVDSVAGLTGECDFILARTTPVPVLRAPLLVVLEAKKADIEAGLGQCVAQVFAARQFNAARGEPDRPVFGCVTNGEAWQFLRLGPSELTLHTDRLFIDNVGELLAALQVSLGPG